MYGTASRGISCLVPDLLGTDTNGIVLVELEKLALWRLRRE